MTTSTAPAPTPVIVDTGAAHAATGITPAKLRNWLHRGYLTRHGHDTAGRALVDLNEVEERQLHQPA